MATWCFHFSGMKTQDSEILRRSSVFRFLSDDHFGAIEPLLQEEHYDFGDVIVKQDDQADSFYVLTRGRARALKLKGSKARVFSSPGRAPGCRDLFLSMFRGKAGR